MLSFSVNFEGNAMGYIRMIRSGGLHCSSNAIRYGFKHDFCLVCEILSLFHNTVENVLVLFQYI